MLKIAYSSIYKYALPEGHRFPMVKYELLPEQLLYEGTVQEDNFFAPDRLAEDLILLTHTSRYWDKLRNQELSRKEERAIGFPMRPDLVERGRYIAQGTIQCALFAKEYGVSLNIAGGTHHAFAHRGEGFCVFNDIAIAANYLLQEGLAQQIMVIDLDVHQGNGTASIFANEDRVFTFSMHGQRNFPHRKEESDLDVGLPDKTEGPAYLKKLKAVLPRLFEEVRPDIAFYLSGVDVLATDRLGRLALSMEDCRERDRYVFETCLEFNVPVAVSMGGGYSDRVAYVVEAHANTFRTAAELYF